MYTLPQHACTNSHDLHAFFVPTFQNHPNKILSGVINLRNNNIRSAHGAQIVHHARNVLLFHHCLHGDPVFFVQAVDGGRALAGCDFGSAGEVLTLDVVGAEHEFLRGDHALDAVGDQADELRV